MEIPMNEPLSYSVKDAVKVSSFSRAALYNEIKAGRLIARKSGAKTVILAADLRAWLDSLPRLQTGPAAQ